MEYEYYEGLVSYLSILDTVTNTSTDVMHGWMDDTVINRMQLAALVRPGYVYFMTTL